MNRYRTSNRYWCFPIVLILSSACRNGDLVDTAAADPTSTSIQADLQGPALTSETIVGGGGVRLGTYEAGNPAGPSIVFIHGFTANYLTWDHQFYGSLASEFRLVAYDLRGHGASEKPLDAAKYTDGTLWADDLDALIRAKHLVRPVLVGWSYGGYIISDYIRKYGDGAIGGVVFLGAVTKQGTPEATGYLTDDMLAVVGDALSGDVQKSIDGTRALTRLFANPFIGLEWERALGSAMMVPPVVRLAMFSRTLDNDDVLSHIDVPTLVVQGAADRVVRVSAAKHIAATVPRAKLLVYDGVGHAVHQDAAQRFGRDLAEFVRATRAGQQ